MKKFQKERYVKTLKCLEIKLLASMPHFLKVKEHIHILMLNNKNISKQIAYTKLDHRFREVEASGFKAFNTVANSINLNYQSIPNYFDDKSTNAAAEFL